MIIKRYAELEELFNQLESYVKGYVVINEKGYYKYQDKIDKIVKDNYYKLDTWKKDYYILKNWKLWR